ncbi:MAG: sulfurtransferase TusA family protein [Desulfuromonas sp.]|nr:MAG: sulfurtransferase TusA family protein [Desulfuromonas sp.]
MNTTETIELDIRGQVCPSTLLTTLREVTRLQEEILSGSKQVLIRTDNRHATVTVPQALENMGLEVHITKEGGSYRILVCAEAEEGVPSHE